MEKYSDLFTHLSYLLFCNALHQPRFCTLTEKLNHEKDVTGIFMSGHPLDHFKFELKHFGFTNIAEFNEVKEAPQLSPKKNKPFKLAGLVVDAQHRVTKTGRNFGSLSIEDFTGKTELMLWSDDYVKFQNYLEKGKNLLVQGEFKTRFNSEQYEFRVTSINMLDTAKAAYTKQLIVEVNAQAITPKFVQFIDKNIKANPGKSTLKFNISDPLQHMKIGLYTLEKGFCMNDEMVGWLEENKDVEVSVVCV